MITVTFTKYHNDNNMPKFTKEFADLDALAEHMFSSMRVQTGDRHMQFSEQRITFLPDGHPCEGAYWEYWVTEIKNEQGILYRANKHCSKAVKEWMTMCKARAEAPEVFIP